MKNIRSRFKSFESEINKEVDSVVVHDILQDRLKECDNKNKVYFIITNIICWISVPTVLLSSYYLPLFILCVVLYAMAYLIVYNNRRVKEVDKIMQQYIRLTEIKFNKLFKEKLTKLEE